MERSAFASTIAKWRARRIESRPNPCHRTFRRTASPQTGFEPKRPGTDPGGGDWIPLPATPNFHLDSVRKLLIYRMGTKQERVQMTQGFPRVSINF